MAWGTRIIVVIFIVVIVVVVIAIKNLVYLNALARQFLRHELNEFASYDSIRRKYFFVQPVQPFNKLPLLFRQLLSSRRRRSRFDLRLIYRLSSVLLIQKRMVKKVKKSRYERSTGAAPAYLPPYGSMLFRQAAGLNMGSDLSN